MQSPKKNKNIERLERTTKNKKWKSFLFGFATSGYHMEGGNETSDWSDYEKEFFKDFPNNINNPGNDYWNKWKDDHDLLEDTGIQIWRTSIEWSRIEPEEGKIDSTAVEKYKAILKDLKNRNIQICLSLFHFVSPRWFAKKGGFEKKKNLIYFQKYAGFILNEFSEYIDILTPINEISSQPYQGYLLGFWPPKKKNLILTIKYAKNLIKAHFIVAELVYTKNIDVMLGTAEHARYVLFMQKNLLTKFLQFSANYIGNFVITKSIINNKMYFPLSLRGTRFTNKKYKDIDFIGMQYYNIVAAKIVWGRFFPNVVNTYTSSSAWITDFTYEGSHNGIPLGEVNVDYLKVLIDKMRTYSKKDIFITECGISTKSEKSRQKFLKVHLDKIKELNQVGYNIIGFCYFSLFDSFEWTEGFKQSFGLVEIDRKTLVRKKRPSFKYYKELIQNY